MPHYWIMENNNKSIWHSKEEKPDKDKDLLIETDLGGCVIGSTIFPWRHVNRWLYIEDIL